MPEDPRYNKSVLRVFVLTFLLAFAACGPRPGTAPAADGLEAYLAALRSDDPKPLYQMLTKEQRAAISYETWVAEWPSHAVERAHQADLVADRWQGHVVAHADVKYKDGQTVRLQQADAGWRLDQALVATSSTASPQAGLDQLVTALERQDLAALFAIMSRNRRESIEHRIGSFLEGLAVERRDGHSNFHRISDSRHELVWSHENVRYRLVFVLEDANWRLNELHMGPNPAAIPDDEPATEPKKGGVILRRR